MGRDREEKSYPIKLDSDYTGKAGDWWRFWAETWYGLLRVDRAEGAVLAYGCSQYMWGIWHTTSFVVLSNLPAQDSKGYQVPPKLIDVYSDHVAAVLPGYRDRSAWGVREEEDVAGCAKRIASWQTSIDMLNVFKAGPDWAQYVESSTWTRNVMKFFTYPVNGGSDLESMGIATYNWAEEEW